MARISARRVGVRATPFWRSLLQADLAELRGRPLRETSLRRRPQVLDYLGRYTHRVAISNHRLLIFDGHGITFRWKDYRQGIRVQDDDTHADEFIRRFLPSRGSISAIRREGRACSSPR